MNSTATGKIRAASRGTGHVSLDGIVLTLGPAVFSTSGRGRRLRRCGISTCDRSGSMLSKKSPRTSCRIEIRNNRIGANGFLNQRCALAPDLESILRARMRKIVLQQNLPAADSCSAAKNPGRGRARVVSRPPVQRLDRTSLRLRIVPRLVRRSHGIPARGCPFSDHEQDRILVVVVRRNTRLPHRFARIWQALLDVASEHH